MREKRYKILRSRILLLAIMKEKNSNTCPAVGNSRKNGRSTSLNVTNRTHRYNFRLSEYEDIKFKKLYEQSGAKTMTEFMTNCILNKPFKVIKTDGASYDICVRLSATNAEIRKIGVNYNQVVKALKHAFTEKLALAYLYRLEKKTIELITHLQKITDLTEEYKQKWLSKTTTICKD